MNEDELNELQRRWEHSCKVAFNAVGQPDRAEAVAHRNELWDKLRLAQPENHLT